MERYRVLDHTADTAIEAEAPDFSGLVENLAYGMFDLMFDLAQLSSRDMTKLEISASSPEELAVDALSDLLFEAEARDIAFASFSARFDADAGSGRIIASGSAVTTADLRGPPIKAVTYHDLVVARRDDGSWYGRVVFDV